MLLLERVATLIRANLSDLVDRAENPEKLLKQIILDMENQYIQVKTQVAIALADLHLLEKKHQENTGQLNDWMSKAELAVEKHDDELARAALSRAVSVQQQADSIHEQIAGQQAQVDTLKSALKRLELKLDEARTRADLLIVQSRRARTARRAASAERQPEEGGVTFNRMRSKVLREESLAHATAELLRDDLAGRFEILEREQKINSLLQELKTKKGLIA